VAIGPATPKEVIVRLIFMLQSMQRANEVYS
jgi:hypothetical protein